MAVSDARQQRPCENCGEAAGPAFCPHCGQELEHRRGPLTVVFRDVLSDWLSLDSRLARSLAALVRPGRLSELYAAGKRAPFLRPFRLYLVASVALFSTILTLETPDASGLNLYIAGELVGSDASGEVTRSLQLLGNNSFVGRMISGRSSEEIDRIVAMPKQEVLDLIFAGWRRTLPVGLILFVPLLALGLKLLYLKQSTPRPLYLDHFVFSLHYQSALFLAFSAAWLVAWLPGVTLGAAIIAYATVPIIMLFVYLPLALRRFYRQSRLWTGVKTVAVIFVYGQLLGLIFHLSVVLALRNV